MKFDFESKTAYVTGAASGIGLGIVRQLVRHGAHVVGADISRGGLDAAADEFGDHFVGVLTDVTDESSVESSIGAVADHFGPLDMAFNVAGAARPGLLKELSEADWSFTIDLVQKGVFFCMKHQARSMIAAESRGTIVNVSSLNAHVPMFLGSAYATAKAGVEMLTKNAALEWGQYGIRVNAVLPGLIDTAATSPMLSIPDLAEDFAGRISLGRVGDPVDVAEPCLFLSSDGASYITGASLVVDGGWENTNYPNLSRYLG